MRLSKLEYENPVYAEELHGFAKTHGLMIKNCHGRNTPDYKQIAKDLGLDQNTVRNYFRDYGRYKELFLRRSVLNDYTKILKDRKAQLERKLELRAIVAAQLDVVVASLSDPEIIGEIKELRDAYLSELV